MKSLIFWVACIACAASFAVAQGESGGGGLAYPKPKTVEQVDDYHGVKVADPYRWLEDTDSADTKAWVEEENKLTFGYLDQIPYRKAIRDRMTKLWNFERFTVPRREGGRYFYQHNNGLQNQNVLLVADSLTAEPRTLLDPNTLSSDGTPNGEYGNATLHADSSPESLYRSTAMRFVVHFGRSTS